MPPSIADKPHVPGGISEQCLYNEHQACNAPLRCQCSCHKPEVNPNIPVPVAEQLEKACPKCGSRRPATESFCRLDGERLASLLCGICGKGMNVEDGYCYNCGAPKGTKGSVVTAPQVVVTPQQDEVDYAKQVLRGVQRELEAANGDQGEVGIEGATQTVVEQPMGTQGSFKLVSAPNPNKVRVPAPSNKGALRLPIKPS